jgi:hypothetical protein
MASDLRYGCMCGSTSVKTSINPVYYIRIFVLPDRLVLKVSHLYKVFLLLLVLYVVSTLCSIHFI